MFDDVNCIGEYIYNKAYHAMYGNDKLYFVVSKCCLMLCEQFFSYIMAR